MCKANEATGVKNAATRKYLTKCHLWYFPPADAMLKMAAYCSKYGKKSTAPYFSIDGIRPLTETDWEKQRAKWNHEHGLTNVWHEAAVHGKERIKTESGYVHANQKPLSLITRQILASTDSGDVVWEPFGGTFSAMVASLHAGRKGFAAEINPDFYFYARERIINEIKWVEAEIPQAA
jgi:site-specific DNA-methyltransferase (adenine-specific)